MNIVSETLTKLVLSLTSSEADQLLSSGSTKTIRDNRNGKYYELVLPTQNIDGKITATFRHCDPPQMFEIVKTPVSANELTPEEVNIVITKAVAKLAKDVVDPTSDISRALQKNLHVERRRI